MMKIIFKVLNLLMMLLSHFFTGEDTRTLNALKQDIIKKVLRKFI